MGILKAIQNTIKNKPVLFTTPGHSQKCFVNNDFTKVFGKKLFKGDFAEIEGLDNLQAPAGAIKQSLHKTAEIYNTKASFYLVNGSSSGIIALILASLKRGEKILISRNAHKSVINALILSGACPVWLETDWDNEWNISSAVNVGKIKQKFDEISDIKAVLITSPTYEGVLTDINPIAQLCKERKVFFFVDEAHGALWPFSEMLPESAINSEVDGCVQSLHKTGSCLNQGALLHLPKESKLNTERIQQVLNTINTTSPSYILLSSIEASIEYLNSAKGKYKLDKLLKNIQKMKEVIKKNTDIDFLEGNDPTKVFFGIKGVDAQEISDFVEDRFNIEFELNNDRGLLALTGIGTSRKQLKILQKALLATSKKFIKSEQTESVTTYIPPNAKLTPSEAFYAETEKIEVSRSIGRICAEIVVKYPPGIPIIIPGEVIQEGHIPFLFDRVLIEVIKS